MTADLTRKPERRRLDRRSGNERRFGIRRRRTDSHELTSVTDEEAVRLRMLGESEQARMRHAGRRFDPDPAAVAVDEDEVSKPSPMSWRELLLGLWRGR